MTWQILDNAKALINRLCPEREVSMRSGDTVRTLRLSSRTQISASAVAVALVAGAGSAAGSNLLSVSQDEIRPQSDDGLVRAQEARLLAMQEEHAALQQARETAEERVRKLTERHTDAIAQLQSAVREAERARAEVQAARARLAARAAVSETPAAVVDAPNSAADIAMLAGREERLRATLEALGSQLTETAQERDQALVDLEQHRLDAANARIDLELTQEHQEDVLRQLSEAAQASLGEMEGVLKRSGVDIDAVLKAVDTAYGGAGGPFIPLPPSVDAPEGYGIAPERSGSLLGSLSRLNSMRIAVQQMPLTKPLRIYRVTSGFGPRRDPGNQRRAMHKGLDLGAPTGTPVHATGGGEVFFAGWGGGYGNMIKIRHPLGFTTIFAHLSKIDVAVGDVIEKGEVIGRVGNTGRSFGSHLHYEIRQGDKALNPERFIEAGRNVL